MATLLPRRQLKYTYDIVETLMKQAVTYSQSILYLVFLPVIILKYQSSLGGLADKFWLFNAHSNNFKQSFVNPPLESAPAQVKRSALIQGTGQYFMCITIFAFCRTIVGRKFLGHELKVDDILMSLNDDFVFAVAVYFIQTFLINKVPASVMKFISHAAFPTRAFYTFNLVQSLWTGDYYRINFGSCFWLATGQFFNGNQIRWVHYVKLDLMSDLLVYNDLIIGVGVNLFILSWTILGFSQEKYCSSFLGISNNSWFDWKFATKVTGVILNSIAYANLVLLSKKFFSIDTNQKIWNYWEDLESTKSTSSSRKTRSLASKKSVRSSSRHMGSSQLIQTPKESIAVRDTTDTTHDEICSKKSEKSDFNIALSGRKQVRFQSPKKSLDLPFLDTQSMRALGT